MVLLGVPARSARSGFTLQSFCASVSSSSEAYRELWRKKDLRCNPSRKKYNFALGSRSFETSAKFFVVSDDLPFARVIDARQLGLYFTNVKTSGNSNVRWLMYGLLFWARLSLRSSQAIRCNLCEVQRISATILRAYWGELTRYLCRLIYRLCNSQFFCASPFRNT